MQLILNSTWPHVITYTKRKGPMLETLALKLFTVANLRHQLS